jgi:hypothetical protein
MKKTGGVAALKKASEGLLYPSETDAPFEAFEWPGEQGKPDKARVLELAGLPAGTPVKVKGLDAFFKDAAAEEDWHDEQEQAQAERFRQLVGTLKETLADTKVFQLGRGTEKDAYIVGRTDTGWAGLKTKVVET